MKRKYTNTPEPRYVELARTTLDSSESKAPSYLTITNIYSVEKGFRVAYTVNDEPAEIEIPLEGTDNVIIDVDRTNMMINVHLDAALEQDYYKMDKSQTTSTIPYWDGTKAGTLKAASDNVANSVVQRDVNGDCSLPQR